MAANELLAGIHERMPLILRREDFDRWLGIEPDPNDVLRPFPADAMTMWPISTRVNSPRQRRCRSSDANAAREQREPERRA
jgi:putative SOS response-associated peptidase YedK